MMGAEKVENGIASVSAPAACIEKKGVAEMSDMREQVLNQLRVDLEDCKREEDTYRRIGACLRICERAQNEKHEAEHKGPGKIVKALSYFIFVILLLDVAAGFEEVAETRLSGVAFTVFEIVLLALVFGLPALSIHLGTLMHRGAAKRAKREMDTANHELELACRRYAFAYRSRPRAVALEDWNVLTLTELVRIVNRGRADTVKEAINVLEGDIAQQRLEAKMSDQMAMQHRMIDELKRIQSDIIWFS